MKKVRTAKRPEKAQQKRPMGRPRVLGEHVGRINAAIPADLLARLDAAAEASGRTRSEELRAAIESHVARRK